MKKAPIYNFKFTVFNICIVSTIWYPNPEDIGKFEHTTLDNPIKVNHDKFLFDPLCTNPTII